MDGSPRRARDRLRDMLREAFGASGTGVVRLGRELGVPRDTLRDWLKGESVPSPENQDVFLSLVRRLGRATGHPVHDDSVWEGALRAARAEAEDARRKRIRGERRDSSLRFVHVHRAAPGLVVGVRERTDERADMNAFAGATGTGTPSYLCWQAAAPVGKTALLADYVRRRHPVGLDILTYFVSPAHGTDTQTDFKRELTGRIDEFLSREASPVPDGVKGWKRLLADAAEHSAGHGRRLLLVVDGLDDDVAWSGVSDGRGTPARGTGRPARGSIAALLPSRPPAGMRVIVSLRRRVRFPDDLAKKHPLRRAEHVRTLVPVAGAPPVRCPTPEPAALGEAVAGLLAVSGGGLRTEDLADLTGLPPDWIERLVQGPAGRALVADDPVLGTYALAGPGLARAVRERLGEAGIARHTRELLDWSRRWRNAGWPEETPPYPLAHQHRLLGDGTERAGHILDMARSRRLAHTSGSVGALALLDGFEAGTDASEDAGEALTTLVPLRAARALLLKEARDVPDGAPALLVRLGDVERARGLARSAPTEPARAALLADVAVELAHVAAPEADAIAEEAAECLRRDRSGAGLPGTLRAPGWHSRLLAAARSLTALNRSRAARSLLLAVAEDPAAGTDTLIEMAGMLRPVREADLVALLHDRAETLGEGDLRARTAAVDLWGALARALPSLGRRAGDRVEAICRDLDAPAGFGTVVLLSASASALACLPARRHRRALELRQRARTDLLEAVRRLRDAGAPAEEEWPFLLRAWEEAVARLALAVTDTGGGGDVLDGLLPPVGTPAAGSRDGQRAGPPLGGTLPERVQWFLDEGEAHRIRLDREVRAEADERRRAKRRDGDGMRARSKAAREAHRRKRDGLPEPGEPQKTAPRGAASRPDSPRRTTGLPAATVGPPHVRLLAEAEARLGTGDLARSRELLETALSRCPVSPAPSASGHGEGAEAWTVELCRALGAVGAFADAEALANGTADTGDRARHLAALSLGCSLGGHGNAGARYARDAARLVAAGGGPGAANAVAQALAHAGDAPAATALVTGTTTAQRRQALTAVAAGLVRRSPEAAAHIAGPLVEGLARRMGSGTGSALRPLPELAALLLAFPDVREPGPALRDALRGATLSVTSTSLPAHSPSLAVLALLELLGCLPEEGAQAVATATDRWRRSLRPGQEPCAELALLAAVEGDTAALWRHADAAPTPGARSTALFAAAAHLAGTPVVPATDSRAPDRVLRTCLALAGVSGRTPDGVTARWLTERLVTCGPWFSAIPLLPLLAPGALGHLGAMARDTGARPA
ncbi:hypothetical protein AB0M23_17505 [Streptomyces sp. NPDC052077]|uniref:hypothetical protein n=1 Tax=Streptomyces sp. NPDC052077 TaxID=3154757 RepID=UPI00343394D4